jgi:regulator of protease activity HflC (stomatin/prohibitin superfamily)
MKKEIIKSGVNGFFMLLVEIIFIIFSVLMFVNGIKTQSIFLISISVILFVVLMIMLGGFIMIQPNEAAVMLLFGKYAGSLKTEGFRWVNPFYTKNKISLRLRTLNGEVMKVNDKSGNPIEISSVVVWKVADTYDAKFEVDNYIRYVATQSESALRHLASYYPYDNWDDDSTITLRGNIDEVSEALEQELKDRLAKAGVVVEEARLNHLAYAPEVAEAMLKRQQAAAIVSARQKIVEGAVGMVHMALDQLKKDNIVELDDERKATMVSNLLVVLCGESSAQPVVNAGSLYN